MKPFVIYFHVGDPENTKEITDITDTIKNLEDNVDAEFIFAKTPKDLIQILMSGRITTDNVLVVFRTGHCVLNNIKSFCIGLHNTIFNTIMHHLYKMPSTWTTTVQPTVLSGRYR